MTESQKTTEKTGETTRFAPSPTGRLHIGHAYAALQAFELAGSGRFLLRIEDIDAGRARREFEAAIFEDLAWLGLTWEAPVWRQSARMPAYREAIVRLDEAGLLYPCFCTRKMIAEEIANIGAAPHLTGPGPDGPVYPGTCRVLTPETRTARIAAGESYALRLDLSEAVARAGKLFWYDRLTGRQAMDPMPFGDIVIARKDIATSYHLAVTVDDAAQEITLVTRAADLAPATHIHRLLQALLALPVPEWQHHALLTDADGMRLAKRAASRTIADLRAAGRDAPEIWEMARAMV
ncbi:MAG: tRNA glutamyl-Q(34) synthetase GluQRS [Alphaproteobacteria bacterium]|nr:tRNA glutamyl-Q(34) synthetase GluQRS [Alphaproteobacteria bacterium]